MDAKINTRSVPPRAAVGGGGAHSTPASDSSFSSPSRGGGGAASSSSSSSSYVPHNGSWVAELQETLDGLEEIIGSPGGVSKRKGDALKSYLRLCRCYTKLRQWENLKTASQKGMNVCSTYSSDQQPKIGAWKSRFASYRQQSIRATSIPMTIQTHAYEEIRSMILAEGNDPNLMPLRHPAYTNSNILHLAALCGDVRLMESMVSWGAAIDFPFLDHVGDFMPQRVAPMDATALVMLCVSLATADRDGPPLFKGAPSPPYPPQLLAEFDRAEECAIQLVRLGADTNRRLHMSKADTTKFTKAYKAVGFDNLSAYELALQAKRPQLVQVMDEHRNCTLEERAKIVHCRCGSRLPWTSCHSTGIGIPQHYCVHETHGLMFRVSPVAKCPCRQSSKIHYDCCWKDNYKPAFLMDDTGHHLRTHVVMKGSDDFDAAMTMRQLSETLPTAAEVGLHSAATSTPAPTSTSTSPSSTTPTSSPQDMVAQFAAVLRTDPDLLARTFAPPPNKGGSSSSSITCQVASWDPMVYAGCLERLSDPDNAFLWTDLHWKLDKAELIRQTDQWNQALQSYCDDQTLDGSERELVVTKHTAIPLALCGRPGCGRVEREVREFQRCSKCRARSYCSRNCQKLDWKDHRQYVCVSQDEMMSNRTHLLAGPGVVRHVTTKPLK